jgi:putative ATP-dependent endonuclease of the OLD family
VPNLSDYFPFLFQDAQRDITGDLKMRLSPLGRVLSKVTYDADEVEALQGPIDELNSEAVEKSDILTSLQDHLSELGEAIGDRTAKTAITPFAKQIRDLTKGIRINYEEGGTSFSMEYHGMGTRSWASLLVIKSFVKILDEENRIAKKAFLPILALEEHGGGQLNQ